MSLFEQASLIVTPNAFKAGKLYSIKGADLDVVRATTATRVNSAGLIESVANNVPRLNYTNGSCPSWSVEPQRTNLITNSNNFASGASNVTVTTNNAISADGSQNASLITGNSGTSIKLTDFNGASLGVYTLSVFAKYNTQKWIQLTAGGIGTYANFDIQNGVLGSTNGTSQIEAYGNGWYRCSVTLASGTPVTFVVGLVTDGTSGRLSTTASTDSFWAYAVQAELGSNATSYIKTEATAVTRNSDVVTKFSISSLIGQTEGTLFGEFAFPNLGAGGGSSYVYFTDGSFTNSVIIGREPASPNSKLFFYINAGGSNVLNNTANNLQSGFVKMAIGYKSGSWAAYLNGSLVASGTDTLSFSAVMSRFGIGTNDGAITVVGDSIIAKQIALFKTRLTNSELQQLTTL
jgi:hypothetical protein